MISKVAALNVQSIQFSVPRLTLPQTAYRAATSCKGSDSVGKRKITPQLPESVSVTLYWIDARVQLKPRVIEAHFAMDGDFKTRLVAGSKTHSVARGTLFRPGEATFESRDHLKVLTWIRKMKSEGWVTAGDAGEMKDAALMGMRAARSTKVDPHGWANKKSGKGLPGSRKPTRDYKGSATVAAAGYAPVRVTVVDRS